MNYNYEKISKKLKLDGFFYAKNFFNEEEVNQILTETNVSHQINDINHKKVIVSQIYNHKNFWKIIRNKKILEFLRNTIGNNLCYLYNSHSVFQENDNDVDISWHRDNPCRNYGIGPDWINNDYNVIRVGIYLSDKEKCQTGLSLISQSNYKKKWICILLKILRNKFKKIYFNKIFRFFLDKFIGAKKIYTNKGDCIFFFANIYHSSLRSKSDRRAIFMSYGTKNNHAQNYLNYFFHHRKDFEIDENLIKKSDLKKYLDEEKIYIEPPNEKKPIEGV